MKAEGLNRLTLNIYSVYNNNNLNNNNLLFVYRWVIVNPLAPQIAVLIEAGQEVHTLNYI